MDTNSLMKWNQIDDNALRAACIPLEGSLSALRTANPLAQVCIRYSDAAPEIRRAGDVMGMPRCYGFPTEDAVIIVAERQKQFNSRW